MNHANASISATPYGNWKAIFANTLTANSQEHCQYDTPLNYFKGQTNQNRTYSQCPA